MQILALNITFTTFCSLKVYVLFVQGKVSIFLYIFPVHVLHAFHIAKRSYCCIVYCHFSISTDIHYLFKIKQIIYQQKGCSFIVNVKLLRLSLVDKDKKKSLSPPQSCIVCGIKQFMCIWFMCSVNEFVDASCNCCVCTFVLDKKCSSCLLYTSRCV